MTKDWIKGPLRRRGCMCWMGPMLPGMGEWAGHLHGHEGSLVGRENYSFSPTLQSQIVTEPCSSVLRGSHTLSFVTLHQHLLTASFQEPGHITLEQQAQAKGSI